MGLLECPLKCGQLFSNSSELKTHLETHLANVRCPFCFVLIDNIHSLPAHLDDCTIKKEVDSEEEENIDYETEIISVLPDDISDDEIETELSVVNPTDPIGDDPTQTIIHEDKVDVVDPIVDRIGPSLLRSRLCQPQPEEFCKIKDESEQIEGIDSQENKYNEDSGEQTESSEEQEDTGQELIKVSARESQELSPAVQKVAEQVDTINEEADPNVYHCSSCNEHFTDVTQHLTENHSNQQVYLQLPEAEDGKAKVVKDDTSCLSQEEDSEDEMVLSNLPSAANEAKDQAIWVNWSGEYYLSTRNPYERFQTLHNLNYVIRPTTKNFSVTNLSPFYMEDDYGDKFFSVPVDTAIDYFEASNGRCGPKRFVGNFARVCIGTVIKSKPGTRPIHLYERVISTFSLSLTHILFSAMPPDHFLPIIVQMNPQDGCDQGVKYKIHWKCNLCGVEIDTWTHHDCDDTYTEDIGAFEVDYNVVDEMLYDHEEDNNTITNKENTVEQYVVTQGEGYKKVKRVKPLKKAKVDPSAQEAVAERPRTTRHYCKKCNIIFFKDSYFFDHVKEKHSDPNLWRSTADSQVTAPVDNAKQDKEQSTGDPSIVRGKYYCQPCKIMFANERWLLDHYQTDHRHKPGYQPKPTNPLRIEDVTDRTCADCQGRNRAGGSTGGLVFESRAWYKLHRKTAHGEEVDPSELPTIPPKPIKYKKPPPQPTRHYKPRAKVTVEVPVPMEPDEVPIPDGPYEPKILRTCAQCVKVKNSIYNLRKHLRDVHEDTSIVLGEDPGKQTTKGANRDTEDLMKTLVDNAEVVVNGDTPSQDEGLYEITEEGVVKIEKLNLYKFKQDGLSVEDVQKRYSEYNVLELNATSRTCELCYMEDLETQHKLLKHLELRHFTELCLESFFLVRRRLQKHARLRKKKIEVLDAKSLPEDMRELVTQDNTPGSTAEQEEIDTAIESLVDQNLKEETSDEPPSNKKRKFQVIKPDDLPFSVRKKIEEHSQANNIEVPLIVQNISTEDPPLLEEAFTDLPQLEDRTNKLSIDVMDFLNYKQKHHIKLNKVKKPRLTPYNKRNIILTGVNAGKEVRHSSVLDFNGDPAVSCMTCRVTFITKRWLDRHKEIFHKNCTECGICSLLIQDHVMAIHMTGHNKDVSGPDELDPASAAGLLRTSRHIEFTCKECNMGFESEEHLSYHKLVHQNKVMLIQKEKCPHCAAEFYEADMLRNHLKVHTSRRVYTCNYCHKYFYILAEKVVHERIHTGVKPYACEICGKAFRKKFSLTMHSRHVHLNDRRYSCDLCSAKFVSNSSLVVHKQRHDPTPRYKCKLCPKMFSNTGTRANHMRRKHYGPIEYVCKLCSRVFLGMSALCRHYKKHEALELKYPCHLCPQVYGRSLFLSKHMKEVHPSDDLE